VSAAAVFLDRDGVLNRADVRDGRPVPPASVADVVILPGAADAVAAFRAAGLLTVVVTNQPDIARGTTTADSVGAITGAIAAATGVDLVMTCPHDDIDGCTCRKPLPGLLLDAARQHGIDLGRSVMVGDRWRDVAAGQAADVATVFIDRGYDEQRPTNPDLTVAELSAAVPWIIERAQGEPT
jgi:D-glycero-D-manno-heptose 1,7-bisphosphate phosphatase